MAGSTGNFGFDKLGPGDDRSTNAFKFSLGDRDYMDRLIYIGAIGHRHNGNTDTVGPPTAPSLTQFATGGFIPAGLRVYYKFAWVDGFGNESAASPEAFIDTPAAILEPGAPVFTYSSTGGTLLSGQYYYVLSAYTNTTTSETRATNLGLITVPVGTSTNRVTLTLPTLPTGATGWNVYRKKPGGSNYFFLKTFASGPTTYVDTGADVEDCNRTLPRKNTTNATNRVTITLPGATPVVPAGRTWKLYRTYVNGNYTSSFLHHIVEETSEGSGIIRITYSDIGIGTTSGSPPSSSQITNSPSKVNLANAAEVSGVLPMGNETFPFVVTFTFSGLVAQQTGDHIWVCEFPEATIIGARATLGIGNVPAGQDVIVDLNKGSGTNPTFTTVYATQANRPRVVVGQTRGARTTPDTRTLVVGDMLSVDIDQAGGGTTPTDYNLTVNVYLIAHGYPTTTFVVGTSTGT